jgi:hypothetical protein
MLQMSNSSSRNGSNIVDLDAYRSKKMFDEAIAKGRVPLYSSHLDKQAKSSPHFKMNQDDGSLAERIVRIKASLEKINNLMAELKKSSSEKPKE